jgi:hypothetical protein
VVWTLIEIVQYRWLNLPGSGHRLDSAALWLAVIGTLSLMMRHANADVDVPGRATGVGARFALVCLATSAIVYYPTLSIGFLSDDHVLASLARGWHLGPVHAGLFRPVPLALWAAALGTGLGPIGCHALNIAAHGLNGFLVSRLSLQWVPRHFAMAAGLLFLSLPSAVEPVAWCAGVFDVLATTFVLSLLLALGRQPQRLNLALCIGIFAAGVLSKETAIVAPFIAMALLPNFPTSLTRARNVVVLCSIAAAVGAIRFLTAGGAFSQPFSRYMVQRSVFSAISTLSAGWHDRVALPHPSLPATSAIAVVAIFAAGVTAAPVAHYRRAVPGILALLLLPLVPVLPFLPVGGWLEGSRYLYLSGSGWVIALVMLARSRDASGPRWSRPVIVGLMAIYGVANLAASVRNVERWSEAGKERDRILSAAARDGDFLECQAVALNLTDSIEGAYVFRSGAREALQPVIRPRIDERDHVNAACRFDWSQPDGRFQRER